MRQMCRERLERCDVRVVLQTVGVDEQPVNREVGDIGQVQAGLIVEQGLAAFGAAGDHDAATRARRVIHR